MLDVQNLSIKKGDTPLLRDVSLSLKRGEIGALLGRSGSGKSLLAKAIVQLLPKELTVTGSISIDGSPFHPSIRGKKVGLIFQDPASALNPTLTVGKQIEDGIAHHYPGKNAKNEALEWMKRMHISDAERRYHCYPHQLSGGQLQRAHAASLLALKPDLLIADEITTGLDPTTAVQILHLLNTIVKEEGLALLWITHDKKTIMTDHIIYLSEGRVIDAPR